jgi:ABC-type transport system involved in multi-copper enzyme maturation permease subunit
MSFFRIVTLAENTVREAVRSRLFYTLLFLAFVLILTGVLVSTLSYVESERIVQDVGLAAIRLLGIGIAIFLGVGLIHNEIDRRTIYTILSKPVSRAEFVLGKYLGLVVTVELLLLAMSLAFALVSWGVGAPLDGGYAAAMVLAGVELMVVVAVATFFSAFTTPMLASLFTVGVVLAGHLSRDFQQLGEQSALGGLGLVTQLLYRALPDLASFNLTVQAVHGLAIAASEVWLPLAYGFGYSAFLVIAAMLVFERRDLH